MTCISAKASHRGAQGEHLFEGYFLQQGIFIAAPKHDLHRVDYVVEWNGQLVRVNVKTLHLVNAKKGSGEYTCMLSTSCPGGARRYTPDEIDYFGIVSLEYGKIWMVPLRDTSTLAIRWHTPYKTHRKRFDSFNWDPYLVNRASTMEDITSLVKLS